MWKRLQKTEEGRDMGKQRKEGENVRKDREGIGPGKSRTKWGKGYKR